jgi:hypothetical protein
MLAYKGIFATPTNWCHTPQLCGKRAAAPRVRGFASGEG